MIPETIFVIVNLDDGAVKVGGGSSPPPTARVFTDLRKAETSLRQLLARDRNRNYEIIEYKEDHCV